MVHKIKKSIKSITSDQTFFRALSCNSIDFAFVVDQGRQIVLKPAICCALYALKVHFLSFYNIK